MSDIVSAQIEAYAEAHTSPPSDALIELAKKTAADRGPWAGMMVGSLEGRFLEHADPQGSVGRRVAED